MQNKIVALSKRYFQNKYTIYLIVSVLYMSGILIGSIMVNRFDLDQNNNIIKHFSWIFNYINIGNKRGLDILRFNLGFFIKYMAPILLLGFTILGVFIIPLITIFKGLIMGLTVGLLVKEFQAKGFIFSCLGLLPGYLVILPGIISIAVIGLSNSIDMGMGRNRKLYGIDQKHTEGYIILFLLLFLVVMVGYGLESFIAPRILKLINLG